MDIKNMQILLVNNTMPIRNIVKSLLKEQGFHNLTEVDDGEQALGVIKNKKIDLIISDWDVPNMKNKELLSGLRSDDKYKHMPFLIVSAEAKREQIVEAAELGISGYLVMPLNWTILHDKMKKIFQDKVG